MLYTIYAGGYMGARGGDGLYLLTLDTEKETLSIKTTYPEWSDNPSFLALNGDRLYAVSERGDYGYISAFDRDPTSGELVFRNRIETQGTAMCHLTLWPDGKHLSAANYMSGSLLTASLLKDGGVDRVCEFIQHEGVGHDSAGRQEGPHMHSTMVSPDGKYLYAADLGLDRIFCYRIAGDGKLSLAEENMQIDFPAGEGPRHFLFTHGGKYLYAVTEMGNQLHVFRLDDHNGAYQQIQSISTLPADYTDRNTAADIHFSPDGRFLYVSNRGKDCLTAYAVDEGTGMVELLDFYDSFGRYPRNFCITPDGQYMLIANQLSSNLVLVRRDQETGALSGMLAEVSLPHAVFVTALA